MKIRQCFLELQLKMSGMFFLRHTVHTVICNELIIIIDGIDGIRIRIIVM